MKKSTPAPGPDAYVAALSGWQRLQVEALRTAVREAAPFREEVKWGHLVYFSDGPVLLIRAEAERVLLGFWRGRRLRGVEPRLRPGGKYEMATLHLAPDTALDRATVIALVREAAALAVSLGDATRVVSP